MTDAGLKAAFRTLGVDPSDSEEKIREARLRLVRTYHPDIYSGDTAQADHDLAEINAAFDIVKSHLKRAKRIDVTPRTTAREDAKRQAMSRAEALRRAEAQRLAEARRKAEAKRAAAEKRWEQAAQAKQRAESARPMSEAERRAAEAAENVFRSARVALAARRRIRLRQTV
ncbi:DnaJ domain-containing protein [Rhodobacterales bacterium HKCCE3408]|nr:DnaJ domain-containing protein [Rhodobacterales bacterium HKCCE3408]